MAKTKIVNENDLASKKEAHKNGKFILRKTLAKYLDEQIVDGRKQGFSSPDASWFKGESIDFVKKSLNNSSLIRDSIFDRNFTESYINDHLEGQKNHRLFVWSFINLETIYKDLFA